MPKLRFTKEKMPTPEEFRQLMDEAHAKNSPLDELLELLRTLVSYEQKYQMRSEEFYGRYSRGELEDEGDFIIWAGKYQVFLNFKAELERQWAKMQAA